MSNDKDKKKDHKKDKRKNNIAKDPSGDTWAYEGGFYIREGKKKKEISRIKGTSLPDPYLSWKNSCVDHQPCSMHRPDEAVFKLYKHWESINA